MKKLVALAAVLLAAVVPVAHAGRFYNEAREAVILQHRQLDGQAQTLVLNDIALLGAHIIASGNPLRSDLSNLSNLDSVVQQLAMGFENLANLNPSDIADLKSQARLYLQQYGDLNREHYALTYLPATVELQRKSFLSVFDQFIESYSYMCAAGRNDLSWNRGLPPQLKPDSVKFSIYFEVGNGGVNKGSYEQYNYEHPDLKNIGVAASAVFTVSSTAALAKAVGPWLEGGKMAAAGGWGTAAAWSGGIIAVAAIASYLHGVSEYNSMMRDYVRGEQYKLQQGVSSEDISLAYVEKCSQLGSVFKDVQRTLHASLSEDPAVLKERLGDLAARKGALDKKTLALREATERRMDAQENGEAEAEIGALAAAEEEIFQDVSTEATRLAGDLITEFIVVDVPRQIAAYSPNQFSELKRYRLSAFSRLVEILEIREKVPNELLAKELEALERYTELRRELLEILGDSITALFGGNTFAAVIERFGAFNVKFRGFFVNYGHVPEVIALKRSSDRVAAFLESK